jgi:penicillin-binding protein 2
MAVVANGGRLYTPHFLHHTRDATGGIARTYEPQSTDVPLSEESLSAVREGMRLVVRSGTARYAALDPYRAAGKTGTAELGTTDLNHAWFAGYAPYDAPKIAFAVVNERVPGGHGGTDAAPILAEALAEIWPEVEAMR